MKEASNCSASDLQLLKEAGSSSTEVLHYCLKISNNQKMTIKVVFVAELEMSGL
jgi:hypothetical protein